MSVFIIFVKLYMGRWLLPANEPNKEEEKEEAIYEKTFTMRLVGLWYDQRMKVIFWV